MVDVVSFERGGSEAVAAGAGGPAFAEAGGRYGLHPWIPRARGTVFLHLEAGIGCTRMPWLVSSRGRTPSSSGKTLVFTMRPACERGCFG